MDNHESEAEYHARSARADSLLTVEQFVEWLRKQPAGTSYDWYSTCDCVVGRYLIDNGVDNPGGATVFHLDLGDTDQYSIIAGNTPHTYGAALKRAEAVLAAAL